MKTFQTQCPNCRNVFTINESQLAFKDGRARCGHCKQIFSAKDNLIKPPPLTESQKTALAQLQQQKLQQQNASQQVAATPSISSLNTPVPAQKVIEKPVAVNTTTPTAQSNAIFPTPSVAITPTAVTPTVVTSTPIASPIDFDLIGEFTPEAGSAIPNPQSALTKKQMRAKTGEGLISDDIVFDDLANEKKHSVTAQPLGDFDILEDFDLQPNAQRTAVAFQSEAPVITNTASTKVDDESWLEAMLAEEKIKQRDKSFLASTQYNPVGAKADVADLLDDLGVDVEPEVALSQEAYLEKMSERLESSTSSQQAYEKTSILVPILWGIGCVFLLGLLGFQYVAFNINSLMKDKNHAQALMSLCQTTHLPCHLAQADLASVEIQTLNVDANSNKTDILFAVINKSSQPILYPNLKLSFQANNSSVANLVLSPEQYLNEKTDQMAPQQITPIKLRLDIPRNSFEHALVEGFY